MHAHTYVCLCIYISEIHPGGQFLYFVSFKASTEGNRTTEHLSRWDRLATHTQIVWGAPG